MSRKKGKLSGNHSTATSEIRDGHLVLDNRGQRQTIYEGIKNENILKKKENISTIHADNMENYKLAYLKLLKFEEDA